MADENYQYVVSTGTIIPDTSEIQSEVNAEFQAVFGTDLILTADTPQGLLATALALARTEVVNNNAVVGNQLNPNLSGGIALDSIGGLTGVSRKVAAQTVVPGVTLTGVAGTTVPAGSQARTPAGDIFSSLSTVVIGTDGTITVDFASVAVAPITCNPNTLTQIVTNVLGWETVNNTNAGVLGRTTQSDVAFRAYRDNTMAFQGISLAEAITSALNATDGVTSLAFRENFTKTDATIDGIFLLANSVWACVEGGADADIAAALLENKSSGSNWNGAVTVNLIEPSSGQTYPVKFDRPTEVQFLVRVTTANGNAANIQQAIIDYQNGAITGIDGFGVGTDVSPFQIAGAILAEYPGYFISKVEITLATSPTSWSTDDIVIALNQIASTETGFITVVITG